MDHHNAHLQLRVPKPNQQSLTLCEANPRALKQWISNLPKANLGELARHLYQCLVEINQLITSTENRLQLLELLRPEVHFVCKHLEKHFLNRAIVLDERPRKVANLCQALQNHLVAGYKLIVVQESAQPVRERAAILAQALQRALYSMYGPLVRASQLYCPVPEALWLEMHQLYLIACKQRLQHQVVSDPLLILRQEINIEQTYKLSLLLGCARTNQMRQTHIAKVAEALELWVDLIQLQAANQPGCLFAFSSQIDGPPRYISLFKGQALEQLQGINTLQLVTALKTWLASPTEAREGLQVPNNITSEQIMHLAGAWGDIAERSFQRTPAQGQLRLCIGMSALHYFLSGERHFHEVLRLADAKALTSQFGEQHIEDIWSDSFDAGPNTGWHASESIEYALPEAGKVVAEESLKAPETFSLGIVNHSPGGYCLSWPKEVPDQLQAGELLGLQDNLERDWSVAVVRWIRQVRGGGTQMGIELIAPRAEPCGLQLQRKNEQHSQFLRALVLPEIAVISQPASLITPTLPFQEGHKVMINREGQLHRAQLTRRKVSSGSFSQFEYHLLDQVEASSNANQGTASKTGEESFDSLWKSL